MKHSQIVTIILGATLVSLTAGHMVLAQGTSQQPRSPSVATDKQPAEVQSLTRSIQDLNQRVSSLSDDLRTFRTDLEEVTTLFRLLLTEQRQAGLEQQLNQVRNQSWDLDSQEAAIRSRLQFIDKEYISTGSAFITQDEARKQIREQLERQLQTLANRRPTLAERERQLQDQVNQVGSKIAEIKQALEALEQKREDKKQEP